MVEILCTTCDSGFVLDQIAYYEEKDKKIAKEETADADYQRDLRYSGPYLDDLEQSLQSGIADYLQEKGITTELARFIQSYVKETKEPSEYKRWLEGLKKFVE